MPDSYRIRTAESSDSEGIARIHTSSWQSAYRGLLPDEWLDALRWQDRKVRWDAQLPALHPAAIYVAENHQKEIIGFASIGHSRDEDLDPGEFVELYAIYLAPDVWKAGIGTALLRAATEHIPAGPKQLSLWVLRDNLRARKFYESQGFVLDGSTKIAHIDGHELEEVRYRTSLPLANCR